MPDHPSLLQIPGRADLFPKFPALKFSFVLGEGVEILFYDTVAHSS
jgi:hypothetical protein